MRVLFLFPYPPDDAPSQRFRFEQYFPLLIAQGIDVKMQSFWSRGAWKILYHQGYYARKVSAFMGGIIRRCYALILAIPCEFIFIHRECAPVGPPVFEWLLARVLRKRIIYDFDDAIWLPNTSHENRIAAFLKWHQKVRSICAWSWKVSCGNQFLADFARSVNPHVIVNPTTIDTKRHQPPSVKKERTPVIGWTGTHSTLPYLNEVIPTLQLLRQKRPFTLLIISNKPPAFRFDGMEFLPWRKESEIEDLAKIDIGIMPLKDDVWAQGKCGLKILQYMAMGIPPVASAVGVNVDIIDSGATGFLCRTQDDWAENLERLLTDDTLCKKMGTAARTRVQNSYSVDSNSSNFASLFSLSR